MHLIEFLILNEMDIELYLSKAYEILISLKYSYINFISTET